MPADGGDGIHPLHGAVDGDDRVSRQLADVLADGPQATVGAVLPGTADLAVAAARFVGADAVAAGDHDRDAVQASLGISPPLLDGLPRDTQRWGDLVGVGAALVSSPIQLS